MRDEVARGRMPKTQKLYFGAGYDVRMEYGGAETAKVNDVPTEADKLQVNVETANGTLDLVLFLARDEARTPAMVRVPFAMGNFSMEWVR